MARQQMEAVIVPYFYNIYLIKTRKNVFLSVIFDKIANFAEIIKYK